MVFAPAIFLCISTYNLADSVHDFDAISATNTLNTFKTNIPHSERVSQPIVFNFVEYRQKKNVEKIVYTWLKMRVECVDECIVSERASKRVLAHFETHIPDGSSSFDCRNRFECEFLYIQFDVRSLCWQYTLQFRINHNRKLECMYYEPKARQNKRSNKSIAYNINPKAVDKYIQEEEEEEEN